MSSIRNRHLFLADLVLLPSAAVLAFVLRLDAQGLERYTPAMLLFVVVAVPVQLLVGRALGVYRRMWRYASVDEVVLIAVTTGVSGVLATALLFGIALPLTGITGFPRSVPVIDGLLALFVMGGPRFGYRLAWRNHHRTERQGRQQDEKRVVVMGAGDAGAMIVKEMQANPQLGLVPVGFLDDDGHKHGAQIHGVRVLGGRERIPEAVAEHGAGEVIIAMPTAPGSIVRQILGICQEVGVPARTLPGLYDILAGRVGIDQLREVDIEDLLRREPVEIDTSALEEMLRGRRVLVTGAGGSIGSELCRQIVRCEPSDLVLLGHGENSIFQIYHELKERSNVQPFNRCNVYPVIADTRDSARLEWVFATYQPELVFHAAAHKHVPLMEANVCEAIYNNVWGTRNLIRVAQNNRVGQFVLISTDKAVKPANVMGATKRVGELLIYQAAQQHNACFVAVRFGNVLGSRGSVLHTFRRQIESGRKVTVTHPEMTRYFMTIPEAVQLVLQAAALGGGGETFVLDMGQPVRIVDLASDLIRLSGLRPKVQNGNGAAGRADDGEWDVEVVFSGVRPGEKLSEELFAESEECHRTCHDKILVATNGHDPFLGSKLDRQVDRLIMLARAGDEAAVQRILKEIVPEYEPIGDAVAIGNRARRG